MEKISKRFFDGEVLVCGCEGGDNAFYKNLHEAMTKNGITVYPMPTTPHTDLPFEPYEKLEDLPKIPNCALVLSDKGDTPQIIEQLSAFGMKKIVFWGAACADDNALELCKSKGIETRMGCPLMLFGGGMHRIHAFFAGVKQERV